MTISLRPIHRTYHALHIDMGTSNSSNYLVSIQLDTKRSLKLPLDAIRKTHQITAMSSAINQEQVGSHTATFSAP